MHSRMIAVAGPFAALKGFWERRCYSLVRNGEAGLGYKSFHSKLGLLRFAHP